MKKQLLLLVMMLLPMAAMADAVEIDGIYYNLISDTKEAEVTSNPNKYYGSVIIPEKIDHDGTEYSVTIIGDNAFINCFNLTSIAIPNSVKIIKDYVFYNCSKLTDANIPTGLTTIGNYTFAGCSGLTTITFPTSLTSIGNLAFAGCSGLTELTIPNSVTNMGDGVFSYCSNLKAVTLPNSITSIKKETFRDCTSLTSFQILSSVTSLGDAAFKNCTSLTSISIPNNVTSLSGGVFGGCSGLVSITIGNGITEIQTGDFSLCTSLESIIIPDNVTCIQQSAFYGCKNLKTIIIGSGIKNIYAHAFANCPELTDVTCYAENVPTTESNAFANSYIEYATLHVPDTSIDLYKEAEPWKNFKAIVGLEDPATEKCSTPTILVVDGKLKFTCETEGVTFKTTYKVVDSENNAEGDEVVVGGTATCQVSVYATKEGYEDSDVATANVPIVWGKKGDVNADGEVNVGDIVTTTNIMAGKDE